LRGINNWEKTQHIGAHRQAGKLEVKTPPQAHREVEVVSSAHRQAEAFEATSLPTSRRKNGLH
jgi:hypothetical protein